MRYYDISITNPAGGNIIRQWTTHPNGQFDPGSLNVKMDLLVTAFDEPAGASSVTIEGIALADLMQAKQFTGMNLFIKGGMKAGLPLANPAQSGLLMQASVFQAFGNWVGTDMTLDFVAMASAFTYAKPGNIVLNWPAGTPLADALAQTLSRAYPGVKQTIQISPALVLPHTETGYYHTLEQLAQDIKSITEGMFNADYPGVSITLQGGLFYVYDGTVTPKTTAIQFTDFVGQPTWVNPDIMQMKTVMRADLQIGTIVTMPPGLQSAPGVVTTTAASQPSFFKYRTTFQGKFRIIGIRHIGESRAPDGNAWVSIFNCVPA